MNRRPTGVIPRDRLLQLHLLLASDEVQNRRWSFTIGECLDASALSIMDFVMDVDAQRDTFMFLSELDLDRARVFAQMVDAKKADYFSARKGLKGHVYMDL